MYIYLDESYNLKDRSRKQCISINGFSVLDARSLAKRWKEYRKPFVGKRRIHAQDSAFDALRPKAVRLFARPDVTLLTVFQAVQEIPFGSEKKYFKKGKLDFERVYVDVLKSLFKELRLQEYQAVKINVDSRKTKGGMLARRAFREELEQFLRDTYPQPRIKYGTAPSTSDVLIEFADFISNMFYRAYQQDDDQFFKELRFKLIQIKNPL